MRRAAAMATVAVLMLAAGVQAQAATEQWQRGETIRSAYVMKGFAACFHLDVWREVARLRGVDRRAWYERVRYWAVRDECWVTGFASKGVQVALVRAVPAEPWVVRVADPTVPPRQRTWWYVHVDAVRFR